jgi:hypothetical protein
MIMSNAQHLELFLAPLTPQSTFLKLAKELVGSASMNEDTRALISKVGKYMSRVRIEEAALTKFTQMPKESRLPELLGGPEGYTTMAAVAYMSILNGLSQMSSENPMKRFSEALSNPEKLRAARFTTAIPPDFLSSLLIETAERGATDKSFQDRLIASAKDLKSKLPAFEGMTSELKKILADDDGGSGSGGNGTSLNCTLNGNQVPCALSVLVLVLVIVLIIVLKP